MLWNNGHGSRSCGSGRDLALRPQMRMSRDSTSTILKHARNLTVCKAEGAASRQSDTRHDGTSPEHTRHLNTTLDTRRDTRHTPDPKHDTRHEKACCIHWPATTRLGWSSSPAGCIHRPATNPMTLMTRNACGIPTVQKTFTALPDVDNWSKGGARVRLTCHHLTCATHTDSFLMEEGRQTLSLEPYYVQNFRPSAISCHRTWSNFMPTE